MDQTYLLQLSFLATLALSLWVVTSPPYCKAFAAWAIFRKRANGIDVSSFEVECVGISINNDKIPQREIAILKSAVNFNQQIHSLFHWTTTYQAGEQ